MENNFNKFAPQGRAKLVNGSVIQPELSGLRMVIVPCSETGKPDTVLHGIVDKKWSIVNRELKGWFAQHFDFKLGNIHTTAVQSDIWVVHMLCYTKEGQLNALAVEACLKKLGAVAVAEKASTHFAAPLLELIPSLGDLANSYLLNKGVHTYFYEEPTMAVAIKVGDAVAGEAKAATESMIAEAETLTEPVVVKPVAVKVSAKPKKKMSKKPTRKPVAKKSIISNVAAQETDSKEEIMLRGQAQDVVMIDDAAKFGEKDTSFIEDLGKLDE